MSQHISTLLLGSNLGDAKNNIEKAVVELEKSGCKILQKTDFTTTMPIEFVSSNYFCNIAMSISMQFSPLDLLKIIKNIEKKMGRMQDSKVTGKYEDRIIDIDIVSFDNLFFYSEKLNVPHLKHLEERDFSKKLLIELDNLNKKHNI